MRFLLSLSRLHSHENVRVTFTSKNQSVNTSLLSRSLACAKKLADEAKGMPLPTSIRRTISCVQVLVGTKLCVASGA